MKVHKLEEWDPKLGEWSLEMRPMWWPCWTWVFMHIDERPHSANHPWDW